MWSYLDETKDDDTTIGNYYESYGTHNYTFLFEIIDKFTLDELRNILNEKYHNDVEDLLYKKRNLKKYDVQREEYINDLEIIYQDIREIITDNVKEESITDIIMQYALNDDVYLFIKPDILNDYNRVKNLTIHNTFFNSQLINVNLKCFVGGDNYEILYKYDVFTFIIEKFLNDTDFDDQFKDLFLRKLFKELRVDEDFLNNVLKTVEYYPYGTQQIINSDFLTNNITDNILLLHLDKIDIKTYLTTHKDIKLEILEELCEYYNSIDYNFDFWDTITIQNLTEELVERYSHYISIFTYTTNNRVSIDFLRRNRDVVNWNNIFRKKNIEEQYILEFPDKLMVFLYNLIPRQEN